MAKKIAPGHLLPFFPSFLETQPFPSCLLCRWMCSPSKPLTWASWRSCGSDTTTLALAPAGSWRGWRLWTSKRAPREEPVTPFSWDQERAHLLRGLQIHGEAKEVQKGIVAARREWASFGSLLATGTWNRVWGHSGIPVRGFCFLSTFVIWEPAVFGREPQLFFCFSWDGFISSSWSRGCTQAFPFQAPLWKSLSSHFFCLLYLTERSGPKANSDLSKFSWLPQTAGWAKNGLFKTWNISLPLSRNLLKTTCLKMAQCSDGWDHS